jgi:NAD(P)-dependent dehydrogenase (short-subunit alcohol dehydrogenase family)
MRDQEVAARRGPRLESLAMGWSTADIPDQTGRVAVVTGANRGLGFETARALAARGALVVLAVRDQTRGSDARGAIARQIPTASLELVPLDLASLPSVRDAAATILAAHPVVDLLVNNAGVFGIPRRTTADGFEAQFGVNHLGHFALTALLMPALLRSAAARVVSVTSGFRWLAATVDPTDVALTRHYNPWRAYGRAKLANLQFTLELDRQLRNAGAPVSGLVADPGFSHTDIQATCARESPGLAGRSLVLMARWFGSSAATGTLPLLRAATDPAAEGGALYDPRFIIRGAPVRSRHLARSPRPRDLRTLWEVSERETGIRFDVAAMARAARGAPETVAGIGREEHADREAILR